MGVRLPEASVRDGLPLVPLMKVITLVRENLKMRKGGNESHSFNIWPRALECNVLLSRMLSLRDARVCG